MVLQRRTVHDCITVLLVLGVECGRECLPGAFLVNTWSPGTCKEVLGTLSSECALKWDDAASVHRFCLWHCGHETRGFPSQEGAWAGGSSIKTEVEEAR